MFIELKADIHREREASRESIYPRVKPQVLTATQAGPGWRQKHETQFRSPSWVRRSQGIMPGFMGTGSWNLQQSQVFSLSTPIQNIGLLRGKQCRDDNCLTSYLLWKNFHVDRWVSKVRRIRPETSYQKEGKVMVVVSAFKRKQHE